MPRALTSSPGPVPPTGNGWTGRTGSRSRKRTGDDAAPSTREAARLAALRDYRLLDAPADDELTAVVRAAALVAGVPHATLNLVDEDRQCQLTTVGFEGADSARADSMCALHFEEGLLVHVPDASRDPRFARNPWVDGRLGHVRTYASSPLVSADGHALGSLCVFDTVPGPVAAERLAVLQDLAGVLVALFERRRQAREAADQGRRAGEARELAVLAMSEAEARWEQSEAVAETVDVGLVVVDGEGHVTSLNRTAGSGTATPPSTSPPTAPPRSPRASCRGCVRCARGRSRASNSSSRPPTGHPGPSSAPAGHAPHRRFSPRGRRGAARRHAVPETRRRRWPRRTRRSPSTPRACSPWPTPRGRWPRRRTRSRSSAGWSGS